jgi:ribonuclease D
MKKTHQKLAVLTEDLAPADLERLLAQPEVAVDTETLGLDPFRDALCLVQICDANGIVNIIRSPNWKEAHRLKTFLASPVTKVFHYALFDCSMILVNVGIEVAHPYCTKIASKLARTYGSSHSLATIVQELLRIDLSKEMQVSDWSGDLNDAQLRYASNDVLYLVEIKRLLEAKLERRRPLATGLSLVELNARCQKMIPTLVQLKLNGWNVDSDGPTSFFGH